MLKALLEHLEIYCHLLAVFLILANEQYSSCVSGGNVLLLNTWGKKSRPYMQALHFVFAFGAFVAPLIVQPFLQNMGPLRINVSEATTNETEFINTTTYHVVNITNCSIYNASESTMPVTWAYWISSLPLAITAVGFIAFVLIKACSLQDAQSQQEDAAKSNQGSLVYRLVILSLFSIFLLLYVGLEIAYGGYIFTFGVKSIPSMSEDDAAFLTSAFWGSFALARLASVPLSRYLRPSKMLWLDMAGCMLGSAILVSQISNLECNKSDHTKLWAGTVILGISMASVFPSAINFAEYFVTVSGKTASVLLVAASFGEMLIPLAVGNTIVDTSVGPCSLMACAFVIGILTLLTYLLIVGVSRYFKRSTGFAGMLYQRNQEKHEDGRSKRQPDEVLQLLEQNNEEFFNGDQDRAVYSQVA